MSPFSLEACPVNRLDVQRDAYSLTLDMVAEALAAIHNANVKTEDVSVLIIQAKSPE